MDIKVTWIKEYEGLEKTAESPGDATHVVIDKEFFGVLMRAWSKDKYSFTEPKTIGIRYNTQCPDCGFVTEGFDTEEEAAAWTCDQCQPSLPGLTTGQG